MKKILVLAVVLTAAFSACNTGKNPKAFSEKDSVAYAFGLDYGRHAKSFDSTLNTAIIAQAISDVMNNTQKMTIGQAQDFLSEYFMVRIPARNLKASEDFLDGVIKNNPNAKKTDSGLIYEVIAEGDPNTMATDDVDEVLVNYVGTNKDDVQFDAGDSIRFPLRGVIQGWREGIKLVGKGGKIKLWIPANLAYGPQGSRDGRITPNEALVFEVDVLDVFPGEKPAEKK